MDNNSFNNDIHLTYEELVAYRQGNLSNREMHRLELHLINCKLCNEALDGIANIDESALFKNLASIRVKTETKSSVSISISTKQWMAMAASIALIAVVSAIIILLPKRQDTTMAEGQAAKEVPVLVDDFSSASTPAEDSLYALAQQEDSLLALAATPPQYAVNEVQAEDVIPEEAKGLSMSDLSTDNIEIATVTDTALLAENSLEEFTEDEIVAEEDRDTAARSKKMAAPAAGIEAPVAMEALKEDSKLEENSAYMAAEPVKGRRSYERYLKRNLIYPDAAKESKIEGEIIVVLSINSFGSITNIEVVQSLGYGCDQEAIRLIREGPQWVPGTLNSTAIDDKVMVAVPFKL